MKSIANCFVRPYRSAKNDLVIQPTYLLDECPPCEIFLIPDGGFYADGTPFGTRHEMNNDVLLAWVKGRAQTDELVLSDCSEGLILVKTGCSLTWRLLLIVWPLIS